MPVIIGPDGVEFVDLSTAESTARRVYDAIRGRAGFDLDVDAETEVDILTTLAGIVQAELPDEPPTFADPVTDEAGGDLFASADTPTNGASPEDIAGAMATEEADVQAATVEGVGLSVLRTMDIQLEVMAIAYADMVRNRAELVDELHAAGLTEADTDLPIERPAAESSYVRLLAKALDEGGMSLMEATANQTYQFSQVIAKYTGWLKGDRIDQEGMVNAPDWPFPDPAMAPEELDSAIRNMAAQLIAEGSALRAHPTPRGWLVAHLLDALGDVLSDWAQAQEGAELSDAAHAEALAVLVYMALQLGLHEVGHQHMARELQWVISRWGLGSARIREHALVYKMLVWDERTSEGVDDLRKAGLLDGDDA